MKRFAMALLGLGLGLTALPVSAQELRSDSPLWTYAVDQDEALFPRYISDAESFGCEHALWTGLYRWMPADGSETEYWRLDNYGFFHCALLFGSGGEPDEASDAFIDYAWIVKLDTVIESDRSETELIALLIGIQRGSQYILLRRPKGDMTQFEVLAPECPASAERRTARIDIWVQDVCVITSQDQLRSIARSAHRNAPAARLEWIPGAPEDVGTVED